MSIEPTKKKINIFGYKVDNKSTLDELEIIYGAHSIVHGKPEFGGDKKYIEIVRSNIDVAIFFNDQNLVEFISISIMDMEE